MSREEKSNLLNELLEYEEKNDIGNLTRAERREFQQWISKALEQEPTTKNDSPKYCDRSICLKNEYNNVGCEDCEVTKSQEPTQSPIIDWNNCHTSEQLDSIATTKNDLGVDLTVAYIQGKYDAVRELKNNSKTNEVLDKIRAEIERQEKWLMDAGYNAYNMDIALSAIKLVVAESEVDNGNDD